MEIRSCAAPAEPDTSAKLYERIKKRLDNQIEDYPYGDAEESKLSFFSEPKVELKYYFHAKVRSDLANSAAQAYSRMGMFDSALRMFNRAAGFANQTGAFAGGFSSTWQYMADCYKSQGQWETAQGYYLKAMIGIGARKDLKSAFTEMAANMAQGKKIDIPKENPDPQEIEKIIVLCARTQLFPDALEAVAQLKKLGKTPSLDTQIILQQSIVSMIDDMHKGSCHNVTFRGINIEDPAPAKLLADLKAGSPIK